MLVRGEKDIRWHKINDQFNVSELLRTKCEYSVNREEEVEHIEQIGSTVITVVCVCSKGMSFYVTSFLEIIERENKTLDEYWALMLSFLSREKR